MLESIEKESKDVVLACLFDPHYKEQPLLPKMLAQGIAWLTEEERATPPDTAPAEPARNKEGDLKDWELSKARPTVFATGYPSGAWEGHEGEYHK